MICFTFSSTAAVAIPSPVYENNLLAVSREAYPVQMGWTGVGTLIVKPLNRVRTLQDWANGPGRRVRGCPVFLQAPPATERGSGEGSGRTRLRRKPMSGRRQQQEKRPSPQPAHFTAPKFPVY